MSKPLFTCRRTMTAWLAMAMLFVLDLVTHEPCAPHIVAIVLAVAGANCAQGISESRSPKP